ncbi:VapC toxin family PIN domain ribonuclease [bacterium]|nr:type II toxin-antitoxin system VapC family toxin [Chloroflexi bacterium CFX6]RIL12114.1 MAG: VapC toxin family PIN domain ribonuclease [bacterium]
MIVADTDVLIDFLADRNPGAGRVAIEIAAGQLYTTAVTRFELLAGARTDVQRVRVLQLLGPLRVLALDTPAADAAAEVRRSLEAGGMSIGMADSLIAGIVLSQGGLLLTRNRRHFERVPGLKLGRL